MGIYRINIAVTFEKGRTAILVSMHYTTYDNKFSYTKEHIKVLLEGVLNMPFKELPLMIDHRIGTLEMILIKKRLEGFPFPPVNKIEVTLG